MNCYPKIWISLLNEEWYQSLKLNERGVWLQLIIIAKRDGDTGRIFRRNFPTVALELGADWKTVRKILGKFHDLQKIILQINSDGTIGITILKYRYWQRLTPKEYEEKENGRKGKIREKSREIPPTIELNRNELKGNEIKDAPVPVASAPNISLTENIPFEEIVNHLNGLISGNYRATTETTRKLIRARFKEGFTLEDFKTVHQKKYDEWGADPKWIKYIRPETLYGTKFESYLNQKGKDDVRYERPF